jgi:hypothetical protein
MSEARTGKRFPLELPIRIRRKGGDDKATTADMSAAGVYIMADTELAVGSPIEFDITLPADVLGTPTDGVACVIDQYEFIRKNKGRR